jgi:hypothetical protein
MTDAGKLGYCFMRDQGFSVPCAFNFFTAYRGQYDDYSFGARVFHQSLGGAEAKMDFLKAPLGEN